VIRTLPELFAHARGIGCVGPHRCFYCGASCAEKYSSDDFVKETFNGYLDVSYPYGKYVCEGCVLCLADAATIRQICGKESFVKKNAMRLFSWIVTGTEVWAATKAHLSQLRSLCLGPPQPPFAFSLSEQGQKHLLYRGVVNHGREPYTLTLEGDRVLVYRTELESRLLLFRRVAAACGKPSLLEPDTTWAATMILERYADGEEILETWQRVRQQPLSRLAAFLTPSREECQRDCPETAPGTDPGNLASPTGRAGRSGQPGLFDG